MRRRAMGLLVLVTACGSTTTPDDDGAGGAGGTTSTSTGGAGGTAPTCVELWSDGVTPLDPDGPDAQIHGTSAFDGQRLWVAWDRPDAGSNFDVWLAAYGCDGSPVVAPVEMTGTDDNELDPALSVSGDRILVAWTSDNGQGADNLDIRYRVVGLDGLPVTDVQELAATRAGVPVTGNALNPQLAPTADGWVLAGSWGHDDATAFQAFAVRIDRDGAVQGEAIDAELDPTSGQTAVDVAVDGSTIHLAWQEDTTTSTAPSAHGVALGGPTTPLGDPGARPSVAAGPWFAWDTDGSDIVLRPPGGADVALGLSGFNIFPRLARHGDDLAMAWMEQSSGGRFAINVARVEATGQLGAVRRLSTEGAPSVYPIDLTLVDATHAVVVYQDGTSPAFRVKAEWVTLD